MSKCNGYTGMMNAMVALSLITLAALSASSSAAPIDGDVPMENYEFLAVTDGPCIPKIGVGIEPKYMTECQRTTEPRRYRGTWLVGFETSLFTPEGKQNCWETKSLGCAELRGEVLPWPSRDACPQTQKFELEFIGRRNVLPGFDPAYTIGVEKLISAKRLRDSYDEDCDPKAAE